MKSNQSEHKQNKPNETQWRKDYPWNFASVPDSERKACCYWEYARESDQIIQRVADLRVKYKKLTPHDYVRQNNSFLELILGIFSASEHWSENFPAKNWLILDKELKKRFANVINTFERRMLLESGEHVCDFQLHLWEKNLQLLEERKDEIVIGMGVPKEVFQNGMSLGSFYFDEKLSNDELVILFEKKLKEMRPEGKNKGGRTSVDKSDSYKFKIHLKQLGAMRLRYLYTQIRGQNSQKALNEAHDEKRKCKKEEPDTYFYFDRTDINDACKAAVRNFQKFYLLKSKEFPRHYTKGWEIP